jgi:anti-sigma factor RsiW
VKTCDDIREFLGAWLDGELGQSDADAVRSHVEGCAACSEERRQLEKLAVSINQIMTAQQTIAFEPFWRGLERRIVEKRSWRAEFIDRLRASFAGPKLAWSIPAVIGLAIALYYFGVRKDEPPRNNFAAVESIDAYGRNVALLRENETRTTVIWLYQNQEGDNESSGETSDQSPTF